MIDGILESLLSVTIDYNLLCEFVLFIKQAWILFEDTMVIRVEGICYQDKIYRGCLECVACCVGR